MQGKEFKGLYKFDVAKSRNFEFRRKWCNVAEIEQEDKCKDFDIWHSKLGHPSVSIVKNILSNDNISVKDISMPYVCTYC